MACGESTYVSGTGSVIRGQILDLGVHVKRENRRKFGQVFNPLFLSIC